MMVLGFPTGAAAREVSILLLRPAHPTPQAAEAIVRLHGELLAAGYAVELGDVPEHSSVRAAMEPPARPAGFDAVVALFGDAPRGPGLLWVVDRATGKTITRPIPHDSEGARGAQILSVRALELLRASFLEAALTPPASPPNATPGAPPRPAVTATPGPRVPASPASDVARTLVPSAATSTGEVPARESSRPARPATREAEPPDAAGPAPSIARAAALPPRAPTRLALEAGGMVLASLDGMSPAVLPVLRTTLVPVPRWPLRARLTVAGLGTRARVNGAQGDAEVSHQLALAEALWTFRPGRRWQPFVSVGAGGLFVSAQGLAVQGGASGRTASTWAFVADAGAGLHLALGQRLYLSAEVHAEGDGPYPAVRYQGVALATEGRPTLLGSLSLMGWL